MDSILVLLINLDRSPERLQRSSAALTAADVRFERLPGVDGGQIDLDALPNFDADKAKRKMGRPLTGGEVGCYLSHLAAIDRFLASDAPNLLVLEDDVDPQPRAFEMVAALPRVLEGTDWDVVQLARPPKKHFKVLDTTLPFELGRAFYMPITTTALLWSRKGAEEFRAARTQVRLPVDLALQEHICRHGIGYACVPPPLPALDIGSEIGTGGRDRNTERGIYFHAHKTMLKWGNNLAAMRRKWHESA